MSDSKNHSNRHKKRVIQKGLRELRNKPGWDTSKYENSDPEEGLRQLSQQMRENQTYDQSHHCEACQEVRHDSGDDSALCDEHLAAAMGFGD